MPVILPYAARVTTPPLPYRGHAPVTWDTRSLADHMADNTAHGGGATHNHDGRYSPSALTYYLETSNGDGTNTMQTINNATWTTVDVAGAVPSNPDGGFNATTDIYTLSGGGIYICTALLRVKDGFGGNFNMGIGIGTANADGAHVQWNKYFTGAGGRCAFNYMRAASFAPGNQLRLYCFQDSGGNVDLSRVALAIWRIG